MTLPSEQITINLGPQHPSTHGVFRLRVTLDGEVITDVEPIFGYLHRGTEKLAEERTYTQIVTLTDRLDYTSSMINNQAYVLAVEKLAGVDVPERALYLRVLTAELQRIASHLMGVGFFLQDLGASGTPLMYCFRERERILDLFEMLCGARVTVSYMRPGGVFQEPPPEFWPAVRHLLDTTPDAIAELERLISENEIVLARTKGVGVLTKEQVIDNAVSGPNLRASGVAWDLRKADPYDVYDRMDFAVPVGSNGDSYDRFLVRVMEVHQSIRIAEQCFRDMPGGPVRSALPFFFRPPPGDAYAHVEASKGELGFYLVSDGGIAPYRCKIRSPSFINLTVLAEMLIGWKVADLMVIFGSLDVNMGEVDR